jgi:hypothetical protein
VKGVSAETERFELSVPLWELHLSRVVLARRGAIAPPPPPAREHATSLCFQASQAYHEGSRYALHARQYQPESASSGDAGSPGGHLAERSR